MVLHPGSVRGRTSGRGGELLDRRPGFERAEDRSAVLRQLPTGVLPLKYAYTGTGAFAHDKFAVSAGYRRVAGDDTLEAEEIRFAVEGTGRPAQLVEIGPGNGRRTAAVLSALAGRGCRPARYLAVDISVNLLAMACARIRVNAPLTSISSARWDIEAGPSAAVERWRRPGQPLTVCLLGHTLGNVEFAIDALRNVRTALRPGDRLIATLAMRPKAGQDVLGAYRSATFRAAVLEPLRAAGMSTPELDFRLSYGGGSVIGAAILTRPWRAGCFLLPAGHRLRCFRSRRFTAHEIDRAFTGAGWHVDTSRVDSAGDHSVVTATWREGEAHAERQGPLAIR